MGGRVVANRDGSISFEGEDATQLYQMIAVRHALRLEQHGFRRSSGRTIKSKWAEALGLGKRASYAAVIGEVERRIEELGSKVSGGSGFPEEEDVTDADFQ